MNTYECLHCEKEETTSGNPPEGWCLLWMESHLHNRQGEYVEVFLCPECQKEEKE